MTSPHARRHPHATAGAKVGTDSDFRSSYLVHANGGFFRLRRAFVLLRPRRAPFLGIFLLLA